MYKGAIIQGLSYEIKKKLDESNEELLLFAITELRKKLKSDAKEIIISLQLEYEIPGATYVIPKAGEKNN